MSAAVDPNQPNEPPPYTDLGTSTPVQTIDAPKLEKVLGWLIDQVVRDKRFFFF